MYIIQMVGAKMVRQSPTAATKVPTIEISRHPYLFVRMLAIGPKSEISYLTDKLLTKTISIMYL